VRDLKEKRRARLSTNIYVEVFTRKGADPEECRERPHIKYYGYGSCNIDKGTHYVTHMRLKLEILKRPNDFDFVLEIMGDYIGTDTALHHLACFVTSQ
jgi:hypothetical protein